ncbi:cache domain-containing protein, partial [Azospirillum isscasi]
MPAEGGGTPGDDRSRAGGLSLRTGLVMLVMAAMLPMLGFAGWTVIRMAETQSAAIERSGQELARTLAVAVDRELMAMETALQVLTTSPHLDNGDLAAFHRQATEVLRHKGIRREGVHILLADAQGQQLMSTRRPFGDPLPRAAVAGVIRRTAESGQTQISEIFNGAIAQHPLVAVALPMNRNGPSDRVLAMSLPAVTLIDVLRRQGLPEGWVAALWDRQGIFITRTASHDSFTGTPIPAEVFRRTASASFGTFSIIGRDGTPLFNAFARSELSGWTVSVGVPQDLIAEPLRRSVTLVLTGGGVLLVLSLAMALAVGRRIADPVAALAGSALALGRDGPHAAPVMTAP